jgi:hypothetical protein
MKQITMHDLHDFLTPEEIQQAVDLYNQLGGSSAFTTAVRQGLIEPNMARINAALGQENDAQYLAYAVTYVLNEARRKEP